MASLVCDWEKRVLGYEDLTELQSGCSLPAGMGIGLLEVKCWEKVVTALEAFTEMELEDIVLTETWMVAVASMMVVPEFFHIKVAQLFGPNS